MRPIDADALKDRISNISCYVKSPVMAAGFVEAKAKALREIEAAPTVESEVRRGRWIKQENGLNLCSVCGVTKVSHLPFCGHCGADMREVTEDAAD